MRKFLLVLLVIALLAALPAAANAQEPEPDLSDGVPVTLASNQILRSGAGWNTLWWEYVARGRDGVATLVSPNGLWVKVSFATLSGWVPTSSLRRPDHSLLQLLPVDDGLRAGDEAQLDPSLDAMRNLQVEMIRINRVVSFLQARFLRLQGFVSASCASLPDDPALPAISDADVQRYPQLETFRRELSYVVQKVSESLAAYRSICNAGGISSNSDPVYLTGLVAMEDANRAISNLRLYLLELTDME